MPISEKQQQELEKIFLYIREQAHESTFLEMDEAQEMYAQNINRICNENLDSIKKILKETKITESEIIKLVSGMETEIVADIIISCLKEQGMVE